jgi:hypothetical protein
MAPLLPLLVLLMVLVLLLPLSPVLPPLLLLVTLVLPLLVLPPLLLPLSPVLPLLLLSCPCCCCCCCCCPPEVVWPALEAQQLRMLALLTVQLLPVLHSLPSRLVHRCNVMHNTPGKTTQSAASIQQPIRMSWRLRMKAGSRQQCEPDKKECPEGHGSPDNFSLTKHCTACAA